MDGHWLWIAGISLSCIGCASVDLPMADDSEATKTLVVGRTVAVITGERSRIYGPEVRFFEVEDQQTRTRFNVEVKSDDQHFAIALPPGTYRLNRVQISEGPFMSMAEMNAAFTVTQDVVTYLGTWRFGVDSPRYGRMVVLSMVLDDQDQTEAVTFLKSHYPQEEGRRLTAVLPEPSSAEARLYEVMPYPRYPRYFQRHVW